jgi:hypothetical protein
METIPIAVFSTFLLATSIVLVVSHRRSWRKCQSEKPAAAELEYRGKQYRRRMITSASLGGLAVLMILGQVLLLSLSPESRKLALVVWSLIPLGLCFIVVLAFVDMLATKRHFTQIKRDFLVERAVLQAQLKRIQSTSNGNGKTTSIIPHDNTEGSETQN